MAYLHFTGTKSTRVTGYVHGFWAVLGLVMLGVGAAKGAEAWGWWMLGLFGVVALGGFYLFWLQGQDKKWPAAVILIHGGAAVLGTLVLGVLLFT